MTAADIIAFESRIARLWESGELPFLTHLCGGNEGWLLAIFRDIHPGDWIFSGHRSHYHYLLAGGDPAKLEAMIREGRSMFVFDAGLNFYTSAVLAGTCGIAAGVAWELARKGSGARVWCFLGDGAEEQGHLYEAAIFVEANDLPCTFVVEDNGRQVDTPKQERRGVAGATQRPLSMFACVRRYDYTPTYPHAGTGIGVKPKFNPAVIEAHLARLKA